VHIVGCNIDRTVEAFGTAIQRGAAHTFAPPHGGGNCTICALPEGDHS
jgi:putative hemolysin